MNELTAKQVAGNPWKSDPIYEHNKKGFFFFKGKENGIFVEITEKGIVRSGTYENAIPFISDGLFRIAKEQDKENNEKALKFVCEHLGKRFLIDMFSEGFDNPIIVEGIKN